MHPQRTVTWPALPAPLRADVERLLGAPVVAWSPQRGGFSPGSADRLVLADGRRAFVKAVSAAANPDSPGVHRREARILAALPDDVPAPDLLGCVDHGDVVALVIEDVEGRQLGGPWTVDDLDAALAAVDELAERTTPCPVPGLERAEDEVGPSFAGWQRLRDLPEPGLDPWAARHLPALCDLGAAAPAALRGDSLVHVDVRGDNMLRTSDGRVLLVDWPWAVRGAPTVDAVSLLLNGLVDGGHDPQERVPASAVLARAGSDAVTALLAGLTSFLADGCRLPAPAGLPALREFQRVQAVAGLAWLRRRTGWP